MIGKLIEIVTGKDDLERVAYKGDLGLLKKLLETRLLLVPSRPKRFLDAGNFTKEEFLEMLAQDSKDMDGGPFDPWVMDVDGKRRLPAFSSQKRMETFSAEISRQLDKVFSLGSGEILLADIKKNLDVDVVDLNLFCRKSWEIELM